MRRVFSPEDKTFRWEDLSRLPKVGELFFELATILSDGPVSAELDTLAVKKNELGVLIEQPIPPGQIINPIALLRSLAKIKSYRSNRLAQSRQNIVTVSRLSAASAKDISRRLPADQPSTEQAEGLRTIYRTIHRKMGYGYIEVVDSNFSAKNAQTLDTYTEVGRLITGYGDHY